MDYSSNKTHMLTTMVAIASTDNNYFNEGNMSLTYPPYFGWATQSTLDEHEDGVSH